MDDRVPPPPPGWRGDPRHDPNTSYPPRRSDPNQSYARRGDASASHRDDPGASYTGRRGDPNQSYPGRRGEGIGQDDHSLTVMPQFSGAMISPDAHHLPSLASEEEERALGIRRPAYIPATEARTGKRPTRWRVISGVLSMLILVAGLCVGSGFLLQRNVLPGVALFLGIHPLAPISTPVAKISKEYLGAPLVTPGPNTTPINGVISARTIDSPDRLQIIPKDPSAVFTTTETVNVVLNVSNQAKIGDTVSVRWTFNGVDITDSLKTLPGSKDCCDKQITSDKGMVILFTMKSPAPGYGKATLYYNAAPTYTVLFAVIVPANTPIPTVPAKAATTPAPTGATPTPGK